MVITAIAAFVATILIGDRAGDWFPPWWRSAPGVGSALTLLCGMTLTLWLLFRREFLRRMAAEAGLREATGHLALLAGTDDPTGPANRAAFQQRLSLEWLRSIRAETPIAVLILDADLFGVFNDRHGRAAGDQVLRLIAGCVAGNLLRPADISVRYGGDGFAVLLPEIELAGALVVAERLRAAVMELNIPHLGQMVGRVTVSIGVAVVNPIRGDAHASLVTLAHEALHDAKYAGRNRISIAGLHEWWPMDWKQTRLFTLDDGAT